MQAFATNYNDYREKLKVIHKSHAILVGLERNHKKIKESIKIVLSQTALTLGDKIKKTIKAKHRTVGETRG